MIKKLSAFIFKDIGWKILALFSAILLYLVIMYVDNPYLRRSFPRQITYINESALTDRGFIILNRDKRPLNVQVNIRAKLLDLENLLGLPSFTAVVDLSTIDEAYISRLREPISLPINISLPPEYTILSANPESVSITIDRIISELRPVELSIAGEVKSGYENMPAIYRDYVTVTAPESIINSISRIGVEVDIKDTDKEVVVNDADLHVYDSENKDITRSVTLSQNKIQVQVPVYPIKTVPVKARIAGNPAPGYWVSDVIPSPDKVDLTGPAEALAEIDEIELAPIQLDGLTSDIPTDFNIWDYLKNTQLSISKNGVSNVNVTVKIDKEATKSLDLRMGNNISIIRDNSSLMTQLPSDPISITIQGPEKAIRGITSENLRAELDLSGLSTGIHDVALHFDLPVNVSVINSPVKLRVIISEEPATATVMPSSPEKGGDETVSNGGLFIGADTEAPVETTEPAAPNAATESEPPSESVTALPNPGPETGDNIPSEPAS